MKRIVSGLLALCLLCALPVTAAARDSLTLTCQERGGDVRLTLEGLDRPVYALQLELVLEGECPDARFDPSPRGVYSPDCHVEVDRDETVVTIYLVAEEDPLSGRSVDLGTLIPGSACRLPGRAELLLLDRSLQPISEGRISLEEGEREEGDLSRVHIVQAEHGTVTVRPAGAQEGETVTLNVAPDAGYVLETIAARDSRGGEVSLTRDGLNRYTFSMPAPDVEVTATFVPGGELAFQDVRPGDWCYDAVRWAFETGLMNGTSTTTFTPNTSTTRGQIVAILYRLEGSPVMGANSFSDVAPGAYYAAAVSWASSNGIVNGYSDGTFRPNNLITREQMAAFLYRYASQKGRDVSDRTELGVFTDARQIASYAVEPLRWAVAAGMINGTSADTLSPGGNASRAQVAVILNRFVQNVL